MRHYRMLLLAVVALMLSVGISMAEKVPQSKALQVATNFFKRSTGVQQQMAVLRTSEDLPNLATKAGNSEPRFYVIGNQSGKGFVIVSADDRFSPVLAYSFESNFSDELGSNIENWFMFLREQMAWAEANGIVDAQATSEWKQEFKAGTPVKELETAQWNQTAPYYNQCPKQNSKRCLTGCVATAICQVMRYHKWPQSGNGVTSTYTGESGVKVSSRNLNHSYDWDNMPLTTSEFDTETEKNAVATLMADVGAALQLNYTSSGTGGVASQPALYKNFGYSSDAHSDYRANYTDDAWTQMLKDEINQNHPVIYDGTDDKEGGHCFVIDGYDNQNYFHVNWGWGGSDNGYYKISALNPDTYKFNSNQDAIFGFKPGSGTTIYPEHWLDLYTPGLGCKQTTFTKGTSFKVEPFMYTNTSIMDFSGDVALKLVDKSGNEIETLFQESSIDFPAGKYMYSGYSYVTVTITKDIKPGYRIRAYYKPSLASEWYPMWRDGANASVKQEILVAKDVEDNLEDLCSMEINDGIVTVTVPDGTTTALYNGTTEVTEGVTKTSTQIIVDTAELTAGTTYKFRLEKDTEVKEFNYTFENTGE